MYSFLDTCQSLTGWVLGDNCSNLELDAFCHEGRGLVSICYDKTGIVDYAKIRKTFADLRDLSAFVSDGVISFYIYLSDLTDVLSVDFVILTPFAIDGGGSWKYSVGVGTLTTGWNYINMPLDTPVIQVGVCRLNSIYAIDVGMTTNAAVDLLNDIRVNDIELISREMVVA